MLAGLAQVPAGGTEVEQGLRALERHDLVIIHVESPNTAALLGDAHRKIAAIERLDEEIVGPLLEGLRQRGGPWRLLVTLGFQIIEEFQEHYPRQNRKAVEVATQTPVFSHDVAG